MTSGLSGGDGGDFTIIVIYHICTTMKPILKLNLLCCFYLSSANFTEYHPPAHFNLAGFSPIVDKDGKVSPQGIAIQHAIVLALRQLNDKHDDVGDEILPSTALKISLRWSLPFLEDGVRVAKGQIKSFGSEKIMGCIGPADLTVIYGASHVYENNHAFLIGYHNRHSTLGLSEMFRNTLRTVPGDYVDGKILADLVHDLHWERVCVFSTSDSYGNLAKFLFEQEAKKKKIEILNNFKISSSTEDFTEYLIQAKRSGVKIFVLLMPARATGRLMQQGYALGVFNSHTQLLGGEQATDINQWIEVDPNLPSVVSGYLGIKYHTMPKNSDEKLSFIKEFRAQESTLGEGSVCNNSTDDTGHYLYQVDHDNDPNTANICTGLNFSTFKDDGSDIPPAAFHAYDAVFAAAHALHSLAYTREIEFINGEVVRQELLNHVSFEGTTGTVKFSSDLEDDGFDVGSRTAGQTFELLNYDLSFETVELKSVGIIHSDTGIVLCDYCTVTYAGSSSTKPRDRPYPHVVHISTGLLSVIAIISSISLGMVLVSALMFYAYRSTKLIKASQPEVGYVILFGCAMGAIRALTAIARPSSALCMSQMWLGHLSFSVVFIALLVKTWKVHKVMNQSLRRVKISTHTTLKIIAASTVPVCIYLLFISTLGKVTRRSTLVFEDQHEIIYEEYCHFELHDALVGLHVIELLEMIYGLYLCFLIRHVPDGISNSKSVAQAVISICGLSVLCMAVLYSSDFDPNVNKTIIAITFSLCTGVTVDKLYRGMLFDLLMGKDMTKAFTIEKGMHRSLLDFLRGTNPAPVCPEKISNDTSLTVPMASQTNHLKYNPKDMESMLYRKKVINEEITALQAELAELMQREMYAQTNSKESASGHFEVVEGKIFDTSARSNDDAITYIA